MPQVRLRPPSRDEQLKLKTNPFAPVAYTKYSHLLIDSHMHNHNKRVSGAKPRVDMGTPESAVKCVKTRAKYYSPARIDLILDTSLCSDSSLGSLGMSRNLYRDYNDFTTKSTEFNRSQECITKTGKQTKSRNKKETNKSTPVPWKHTTRTECLGQKTSFPSLVSSVCASQLVTRREKRNVKYKHIKSKVKQMYFDKQVITPKSEDVESGPESTYSSDPDHQTDEEPDNSHLATREEERNVNLGETFNLDELLASGSETKNTTNVTSQDINIEPTEVPISTMKLSDLESEPILDSEPVEDELKLDLDLEYLKLKRSITEECVKLQIFTPGAILKVCEKMTASQIGLDPEQVSKLIGQILRELEID